MNGARLGPLSIITAATERQATELDLSELGLRAVPTELGELRHLKHLDLSGNRLTTIPDVVWQLRNLTHLNLARNRLTSIPEEIRWLGHLEELDISDNRLVQLPSSVALLELLRSLCASSNQLTTVGDAVAGLAHLEYLNISRNRIGNWPQGISTLAALRHLDISGNPLTDAELLEELPLSIRALDLSASRIRHLPEIGHLAELEVLFLEHNLITELPASLARLDRIRTITLRGNPIDVVSPALRGIVDTTHLRDMHRVLREHTIGGPVKGRLYFEHPPYLFDFVLGLGSIASVAGFIRLYFRRQADLSSVDLTYPNGARVRLTGISEQRAIRIAREHQEYLAHSQAIAEIGPAYGEGQRESSQAFVEDTLFRLPGTELLSRNNGRNEIRVVSYHVNGRVGQLTINSSGKSEATTMSETYNLSGDFSGAIVTIKSSLSHVTQAVNSSASISEDDRKQIHTLVAQLEKALESVPPEKREDAAAIAEGTKDVVDKATKPEPNRKSIQIAVNGLKEASKDIVEVIPIVTGIITLIGKIVGLG